MPLTQVALIHTARREGGALTRVEFWRSALHANDIEIIEFDLSHPTFFEIFRGLPRLIQVIRGNQSPECLAYKRPRGLKGRKDIDAVIVLTIRAFDSIECELGIPIILDYVDHLSKNYINRSELVSNASRKLLWKILAKLTSRVEGRLRHGDQITPLAAGYRDSQALNAIFVPSSAPTFVETNYSSNISSPPTYDLLFFGNMDYEPNISVLRYLASGAWQEILDLRPGTSLCIAGRRPTNEVKKLCLTLGATFIENFPDVVALAQSARLSICPISAATGIQNKVLEAAAASLPQVISSQVAEGLDPLFPITVSSEQDFPRTCVDLLDNPQRSKQIAKESYDYLVEHYSLSLLSKKVGQIMLDACN
ncbi:MAG: glycosyltransferase [Acidimicrobiales bacterium]|nr:glycosyltransferase [Acidimicrobiales bacterium]